MDAVVVNNLNFKYKNSKEKIINDLSFKIKKGETVALLGNSGSGKSTLCNCICGLIPKIYEGEYFGDVIIFGQNIKTMTLSKISQKVGIIFQNPVNQLFSPTIEDELAFGPENLCVDREEIGHRIDEVLKLINMEEYRCQNPNNISGGQQQLIAIASVLMLNPEIIICDEIMSFIDREGKEIIKNLLKNLKERGKTIIIVDHDLDNIELADRTINIEAGLNGKF